MTYYNFSRFFRPVMLSRGLFLHVRFSSSLFQPVMFSSGVFQSVMYIVCFNSKCRSVIYTWKLVREHYLYYEAKLWTNISLHS